MSDESARNYGEDESDGLNGRRRELRALLVSAANAARQGRRIPEMAGRLARPVGRAVRDRVSMLLTAAR